MTKQQYDILKDFCKWLIDKKREMNSFDLPDLLVEFCSERENNVN